MSKTISFTDNSSNASTWLWNFGDGNTSTEQNPIHTFETFGSYMVTLTVTDGMGNADETQQFIEITDTSGPVDDSDSNPPPDPPELEEEQEEQQEQQQEEQQEEQQTYTEPQPNAAPAGWSMANIPASLMAGALSPEGQWVWGGYSWSVNPNYSPPETTTNDETDNTEESGNTQPTTQTYTLTGTVTKFGSSSGGPFNISNENYPTLLSDISVGDAVSIVGSPGVKVITDFNLAEKRITISPGIPDALYGESFSFSMTIVSEQIGLQPGDTSGNTGGDTGGDNGDTGDGGDDDGYGDGDGDGDVDRITGSGGIPRP